MWLTLGSFSLSYKRQRYKRLSGPSSIIHTKKKKKPIFFTFIHSQNQRPTELQEEGAFVHRSFCNSAQNGLQSCWLYVPLHGMLLLSLFSFSDTLLVSAFFFSFLFFFFLNTSFGFSFFLVWNSGPPSKAKWKSQNFSPLFSRYVTLSLSLCVG